VLLTLHIQVNSHTHTHLWVKKSHYYTHTGFTDPFLSLCNTLCLSSSVTQKTRDEKTKMQRSNKNNSPGGQYGRHLHIQNITWGKIHCASTVFEPHGSWLPPLAPPPLSSAARSWTAMDPGLWRRGLNTQRPPLVNLKICSATVTCISYMFLLFFYKTIWKCNNTTGWLLLMFSLKLHLKKNTHHKNIKEGKCLSIFSHVFS